MVNSQFAEKNKTHFYFEDSLQVYEWMFFISYVQYVLQRKCKHYAVLLWRMIETGGQHKPTWSSK